MLHITKQSKKCCGTCEHWNGVRVHEDDGHVYSLGNVEAVCRKLCGPGGGNRLPLTLPSAACPEWECWGEESARHRTAGPWGKGSAFPLG